MIALRYCTKVWLILLLAGCAAPIIKEEGRKTSPDGLIDAVKMYYAAGGAAGFATTQIFLVPTGMIVSEDEIGDAQVSISSADFKDFEWLDDSTLEVTYEAGNHIYHFESRYRNRENRDTRRKKYEIILKRIPSPVQTSDQ